MVLHVEGNAETYVFCGQQRLFHAPPFVNVTLMLLSPRWAFILFNFSLLKIVYSVYSIRGDGIFKE